MVGAASILVGLLVVSAGCTQSAVGAGIGPAPREFRGAWVATVNNIDWPSRPGLSKAEMQRELDRLLDAAASIRLNAILFQVRPAADAFYRSDLEPWSEWLTGRQGQDPGWDPLEHAIEGAHRRGLELHAWFNPFRAKHATSKSSLADNHFARRPGVTVKYGSQLWLDPGVDSVREHSLAVMFDVVERYDIDGVHIDDYFYPYPSDGRPFEDDASFRAYRSGGGRLARGDWRRANVNDFVEAMYRGVKRRKSWVKVGISPFGIARPGVPAGIQAGVDQFRDLAADVRTWMREGWYDYLSPQLYWPTTQTPQAYGKLQKWWAGENRGRHLWVGNFTSKAKGGTRGWSLAELEKQIRLTRSEAGATGNVHFSMKALMPGKGVGPELRDDLYERAALVPASPWLDDDPPEAPTGVRVKRRPDGDLEVRWAADSDAHWRTVWLRCSGRWTMIEALGGGKPGILITASQLRRLRADVVAVGNVDRCGNEGPRVAKVVPAVGE